MCENLSPFNYKRNIRTCVVINQFLHIESQIYTCLYCNGVILQFNYIKYIYIIKPFVSVESTEDIQLFVINGSCRMSLSSRWRPLCVQWMLPGHRLNIQNEQVIAPTPTIISSEQINFVSNQICRMPTQPFWRRSENIRLTPPHGFRIEYMQVF